MNRSWCYVWYLFVILSLSPVLTVLAKKDVRITFFQCNDLPYPQTSLEACFVNTPRKGPQVVTLILSALSVIRRVYIDFVVYSQYQHSRTYLFGTTIDYCEYIASTESYTNPVAKIVYAVAMQKFPHALLRCPASGVVNISNINIDENIVPPIMPSGRFHTNFRMYNKRNQTLLAWVANMIISQAPFNQTMISLG